MTRTIEGLAEDELEDTGDEQDNTAKPDGGRNGRHSVAAIGSSAHESDGEWC